MNKQEIIKNIREGVLDINNQELFFSTLIKGLLLRLDDDISIRGISVPHFILHTGDDTMYLKMKGLNNSIEPGEVSNEEYIYNIIPRCLVEPGGIDLVPDLLTSPYVRGILQYESDDMIYNFSAEFRRMPVKFNCDIKYYVDSYRDYLELVLQIISKLAFIRTYNITYMGQVIKCSYKIPEAFSGEHIMELDGTTTENKCKTVSLSLEVETNYPVFANKTIASTDDIITKFQIGAAMKLDKDGNIIHITDPVVNGEYTDYLRDENGNIILDPETNEPLSKRPNIIIANTNELNKLIKS